MASSLTISTVTLTLTTNTLITASAAKKVLRAAEGCLETLLAKQNRLKLAKKTEYCISLEMVADDKMAKLNRIFRGKSYPTDVLTFARWEARGLPKGFVISDLGDVLVAPAIAKRQAKEFHNTYLEELQRLTVHGLLHLFGYDHETNATDAKKMFALQERILKNL